MFALADAVEQVEQELTIEKEKCAALTLQVNSGQVRLSHPSLMCYCVCALPAASIFTVVI